MMFVPEQLGRKWKSASKKRISMVPHVIAHCNLLFFDENDDQVCTQLYDVKWNLLHVEFDVIVVTKNTCLYCN